MKKVLIVGGGPSGLTAAIFAKTDDIEVTLMERGEKCGKKLLLTGNGRCNFWNNDESLRFFHSESSLLPEIITSAHLKEAFTFIKDIGIIPFLKDNYYYPFTNQSFTMRNALVMEAQKRGVHLVMNTMVEKIEKNEKGFLVNNEYFFDRVILANGSKAYPKTGSDGQGYLLAKSLGHTITFLAPSLVQVILDKSFLKQWAGIRTFVKVSLYENDKFQKEECGELQLTDYGLSGICIFNLSRIISQGIQKNKKEEIVINFLPFIDTFMPLVLEKQNEKVSNRSIGELLENMLHYKLVQILLSESHIDYNRTYETLTILERKILCQNLGNFKVEVIGTKGFDNAQVCSGGVSLDEINRKTLESKITKGLYIVGELLDIDGDCGGYNLMSAFTTGLIAGKGVSDDQD